MHRLEKVRIAGFKSIRDQEVTLEPLNLLIGANGAGKSNFIGIFRLLNELVSANLQVTVAKAGGADKLLHFGRKVSDQLILKLYFGPNSYCCTLEPGEDDSLIFASEEVSFQGEGYSKPYTERLVGGRSESRLFKARATANRSMFDYVVESFRSWRVYHFHDTGESAKVKQTSQLGDNAYLRPDAGNLASFLYRLQEKEPQAFQNIVGAVQMVAPFFDRFVLEPDRLNPETIRLEWLERGSTAYFNAHALSDGTLRFICLATLLLQPEIPTTVIIDEPELGLHPYAITLLAALLQSATERTQLVVSTQSVTLVNQFAAEDLIVVDRQDNESTFRRLGQDETSRWLEHYSLGELWEKNVLGGRPS